jgi:hypothetical protein
MDVLEEFFPSKHLKATDLNGKEVRVTIANVEREKLGEDLRPVVYFKGKEKGVALNKGNTTTLVDAFGRNSNDWFGQDIILLSVWTDYQGKPVQGIRIRIPTARDAAPARREDTISSGPITPPRRATGGVSDNMAAVGAVMTDDDIPFAPEFR